MGGIAATEHLIQDTFRRRYTDAYGRRRHFEVPTSWFDLNPEHRQAQSAAVKKLDRLDEACAAMALWHKAGNPGGGETKALYVIGVDGRKISKIGIAAHPVRRRQGLQDSHYRELFLYAVIFMVARDAIDLEQAALKQASPDKLRGEWVDRSCIDTLAGVFETAASGDFKICDCATFIANKREELKQIAEGRRSAHLSPPRGTSPGKVLMALEEPPL